MSLQAFKSLKHLKIMRTEIEETNITASSANTNEINVTGIVRGKWCLYIGKKCPITVTTFII